MRPPSTFHSKLVVAVGGRTSWTYLLVGADVELVA